MRQLCIVVFVIATLINSTVVIAQTVATGASNKIEKKAVRKAAKQEKVAARKAAKKEKIAVRKTGKQEKVAARKTGNNKQTVISSQQSQADSIAEARARELLLLTSHNYYLKIGEDADTIAALRERLLAASGGSTSNGGGLTGASGTSGVQTPVSYTQTLEFAKMDLASKQEFLKYANSGTYDVPTSIEADSILQTTLVKGVKSRSGKTEDQVWLQVQEAGKVVNYLFSLNELPIITVDAQGKLSISGHRGDD